jgi:hypothetical protein
MRIYATGFASSLAGLGVGWALFRLPEWACGPFRADKAAEWTGVLVAVIAATVTFAAVIVALRTAKDARETTLLLQKREFDRQHEKDNATRSRLAIAFHRELFMLNGELVLLKMELELVATLDTWGDIYFCITGLAPGDHLSLLERFASDLHVFSVEDSTALLNVLSSWVTYRQSPKPPEFTNADVAVRSAKGVILSTDFLMMDVRRAHAMMLALIPKGIEVSPLNEP